MRRRWSIIFIFLVLGICPIYPKGKNTKFRLSVVSPVNVKIFINQKPLMKIDRRMGEDSVYRYFDSTLDSELTIQGKGFVMSRSIGSFYYGKTDNNSLQSRIWISLRVGTGNQADILLSESQLREAYGNQDDIPNFIKLLEDKDTLNSENKRLYASEALGYLGKGNRQVTEALVKALRDENVLTVKTQIVRSIGMLGDKTALEPLKEEFLKHKRENLQVFKDSINQLEQLPKKELALNLKPRQFRAISINDAKPKGYIIKEASIEKDEQSKACFIGDIGTQPTLKGCSIARAMPVLPKESKPKPVDLNSILKKQERAYNRKDYKRAVKIADKGLLGVRYRNLPKGKNGKLSKEEDTYLNILYKRALSLSQQKRYDRAIQDFEFVLSKQPKVNVYVYFHFAKVFKRMGKIPKAISLLQDVLTKYEEKEKALVYYNLGWYYYLDKQIDKAIYASEKSYELSPDDPELAASFFNGVTFHFAKGEFEKGFQWLFRALNISFVLDESIRISELRSHIFDLESILGNAPLKDRKYIQTALWFLHKGLNSGEENDIFSKTEASAIPENVLELTKNPKSELFYLLGSFYSLHRHWELRDAYYEKAYFYKP